MKKITSILLALMMILSVMMVGVTSVSAASSGSCGANATYTLDDNGVLTISGTGTIRDYAFNNNTEIREVIIEDGVTYIDNAAFLGCSSLTSVTIPDSVTTIGEFTFYNCESLTSVIIPDSVTSIGYDAFNGCSSLTSITIPNSVTEFGVRAFGYDYSSQSTDIYTSNQLAIDYFLNIGFHHSVLGEYYVNYDEPNMIMQSGGSRSSIVTLDYETANLRVTVPTVLPVSVDSDNNVTVSDNAKIVNNSKGQVDVTNAVLSGNNSWSLAAFDTDFKKVPVDTKQYGFKLQGYSVPVNGNAYNNQFDTIDGNSALDLSYDANVAIQSDATTDAEIGNIVFTVAWHK